jgi:hypothetical protein
MFIIYVLVTVHENLFLHCVLSEELGKIYVTS